MTNTEQSTKPLNAGQQIAADGFFDFLFSDNSKLIISGPGGVGKTYLMGHLIDQIIPRYHESCRLLGINPVYNQVQMTATTNKAAEVLGKSTGRPTKTIHSFMNLRVVDDYDTGVSRLSTNKNWKVHHGVILFVDECSMVDSALLRYLGEGTHKCKIVFVGDHCQLAPVTEVISPIYREGLPFYELTEPMRNADQPALMAVCNQLRQTVETKVFRPIQIVPGVIDLFDGPRMEKEIEEHFLDPSNHDRILAYTNTRVVAYNNHIRQLRGLPPFLSVGERVVNNAAIELGGNMMAVEDEFVVVDVSPRSDLIEVEPGTELEVRYCSLQGVHKSFTKVPVPVDREHFHQLTRYYAKQKNWRLMYQLKGMCPDLRPRDAATVHKAQGSTYETVFLDLDDLSTCRNPDMAARLLYVAFTRARKRVVLYGKLAPKFGGITT